jgi:transposase
VPGTLAAYIAEFQQGLDVVRATNYKGQPSELHHYSKELKAHFTAHAPQSMKQAAAEIEEKTGLKRSTQQVRLFLRSLGLPSPARRLTARQSGCRETGRL